MFPVAMFGVIRMRGEKQGSVWGVAFNEENIK